ncbi:hypothetical protein K438DRAFT_1756929 [Mycena galopus ATCC 62051]|nr:hypothetical protein K438DRAFT_1756929 [Mycena galopus ATCC 62051]
MSSFALGPLSNRDPQYQNQNTLVVDKDGRLRYAPVSRRVLALPLEILAEIFAYCLPESDFVTPSLTTAPLILCGVCHQWRAVAISTPELWSSLDLNLPLAAEEGAQDAYVDLYRTWLSRARAAPLSLALVVEEHNLTKPTRSLLHAIVALSPQWRKIEVDLGSGDVIADFMGLLFQGPAKQGFPLLEKFIFGSTTASEIPISFCNTPRLREIDFNARYPPPAQIQFPWAQITTFRTSDIGVSSCLEILDDASNLVHGTFDIRGGSTGATTILSMQYLQSLSLSGVLDGAPMAVLECLKTPALKSLALQFHMTHQDVSPFLSFVSRSAFRLHSLALSLVPMVTDTLISCLKAVPSLVHLKLEPSRIVGIDSSFAPFEGDTTFLPKLESLHIFLSGNTVPRFLSSQVVARMLRWRWDTVGIARLRSFQMPRSHLHPSLPLNEEADAEFVRLRQEGMNLYFGRAVRGDSIDSFRTSVGFHHLDDFW